MDAPIHVFFPGEVKIRHLLCPKINPIKLHVQPDPKGSKVSKIM